MTFLGQPKKPTMTASLTNAVAESVVDHCSGSPDADWGTCCEGHDRAFELGSRWRLDRFFAANAKLGWCIATSKAKTPVVGRIARFAIGTVYAAATSTVGIAWWIAAKPVASKVEEIARDHIEKSGFPSIMPDLPSWADLEDKKRNEHGAD